MSPEASPQARRGPRLARVALIVLVNLAILVALLAALELGFRLFAPAPHEEIYLGTANQDGFRAHEEVPYIAFHATPNVDVMVLSKQQKQPGKNTHIVTNRFGFRHADDLVGPKPELELRIFMLGGSVVFHGLSNDATICGVLQRKVSEHVGGQVRVRCVNAGIFSAVTEQELAVLVHQIADLEPDIVIAFDGFNDIWTPYHYDTRLGYPFNWFTLERAQRMGLDASAAVIEAVDAVPAWKLVLGRSRLLTRVLPGLTLGNQVTASLVEEQVEKQEPPTPEEIVAHLLLNWRKMQAFTEAVGGELVAILQPASPSVRDRFPLNVFYDRMNAEIEQARAGGEPFYSLDRVLDERPDLFYDQVHTWDDAHEIYAERILQVLIENGSLRRFEPGASAPGHPASSERAARERSPVADPPR